MNLSTLALAALTAIPAVAAAAAPDAWASLNQSSVPFLGVSLVVVSMAATGALISFGVGATIRDRRRMIRMAFINTLAGSALTGLMPMAFGWDWATQSETKALPPMALLISMSLRFLIPIAIDLAPMAARGALNRFFAIEPSTPATPVDPEQENIP